MNHYKRAIELDPTFAGANANLAMAIAIGTARGQITDPAALEKAEWYARQAVRLDPNLSEAHLALGRVFVRFPGRFREATRENLAALRLAPISDAGGNAPRFAAARAALAGRAHSAAKHRHERE